MRKPVEFTIERREAHLDRAFEAADSWVDVWLSELEATDADVLYVSRRIELVNIALCYGSNTDWKNNYVYTFRLVFT